MLEAGAEWECRNVLDAPTSTEWRFQTEDNNFRNGIGTLSCDRHFEEGEKHGYRRENCPGGIAWLGACSTVMFDDWDGIDQKHKCANWRFNYSEPTFLWKAFCMPPKVHFKEEEFHEYHKKDGEFNMRFSTTKPGTIIPPSVCSFRSPTDTCSPPPRKPAACPPVPQPMAPECVHYPNSLGEREWHTVNRNKCEDGTIEDQKEYSHYERTIKSCNPCDLPQANCGRIFALPETNMRPNEADDYSPTDLPVPEELPPAYSYTEDEGHCEKRATRGWGPYNGYGYIPQIPLCAPFCVPFGYYLNEQESQSHVKKQSPPCPPASCPS